MHSAHAGSGEEGLASFDAPSEERASFATDETQVVDIATVPDPPEAMPTDTTEMSAEEQRRAYQGVPGTPTQAMLGNATPDHETPSSKVGVCVCVSAGSISLCVHRL